MNRLLLFAIVLSVVGAVAPFQAFAQCPEVLDANGLATDSPAWADCHAEAPELEVTPAADWSGVVVDWGDGSPVELVDWVAGDAPLTHTYPDGAGAYGITLSHGGCDVVGNFEVIPPVANLTSGGSQVCEGSSMQFQQTGTGGGQNLWNFGLGSSFIPTSNGVVSYHFTNLGVQTVTNIYVSDIDPIGCRDTSTINILVKPKPEMELTLSDVQGCGPTVITGAVTGDDLTNAIWSFAIPPYFAAGLEMPSTTVSNIGANPISVTGIGNNGCNVSMTQSVTIYPEATVTITTASGSACQGELTEFTGTASIPIGQTISDVTWDFGDGTTQNGLNASHAFTEAGVYPVSLTVETNLCSNTTEASIEIQTAPTISLTASALTGCAPFEVAFSGEVADAATYSLDLGSGGITDDLNTVHTFAPSTNTVTLSAQSSNGCASETSLNIEALTPATVDVVNVPGPTCGLIDIPLETVTSGATSLVWSATNGWNSTETMPQFTLSNNGTDPVSETVSVTAVASNGCNATAEVNLEVLPEPDYNFYLTSDTICAPLMAFLPSMPGAVNFTWDFGDGDESTNNAPFHLWANPTDDLASYTVTFTGENSFGCSATAERQVHIKPQPMANFALSNFEGCDPLELTFYNQGNQGSTYTLTTSTGQILPLTSGQQVDLTFTTGTEASTFEVELFASHVLGCSDVHTETVEVLPSPAFSLGDALDADCTPYAVDFEAVDGLLNPIWEFGDGNTSTEAAPSHTFENAGNDLVNYQVSLSGANSYGCAGSASVQVPVKPVPVADFDLDATAGCAPFAVTVTNTSTPGATYDFSASDGTTWTAQPSETLSLTLAGGADVELSTIALTVIHPLGCQDTRTEEVTIYPQAQFDFALEADSACSPMTVALPTIDGAADWTWTFSDGSTAPASATEHTFTNAGNTLASFTVEASGANAFGCTDAHAETIHVKPQPVADFDLDATAGCAPFAVAVTNTSTPGATYDFTASDGTTWTAQPSETLSLTLAGGADVELSTIALTVTHPLGCQDTRTEDVTIYPQAQFDFALEADSACSPMTVALPTIDGAADWTWTFSDGSTATASATEHTFTNAGNTLASFTVEASGANSYGCTDAHAETIHVKPQPVADFDLDATAGCAPFAVAVTNTSTPGATYDFTASDGTTWTAQPSETLSLNLAGGADVELSTIALTVTHPLGCQDTRTEEVTIYPQAQFDFALEADSACSPMTVALPTIDGAADWTWTFSDGSTAPASATEHTFTNAGNTLASFTVEASGANAFGCTDAHAETIHVKPQPVADLTLSAVSGCSPFQVTATNAGTLGTTYTFSTDAGLTYDVGEAQGQTFTFAGGDQPENRSITLTAVHALGCTDEATATVEVLPAAAFTFEVPFDSACSPYELTTPNILGAAQVNWRFDNGSPITEPTTISFANATMGLESHTIEMEAFNPYGCSNLESKTVHVKPQPVADFTLDDDTGCAPFPVIFTNTSTQGESFHWDYGDDHNLSTTLLGAHSYLFEGEAAAVVREIKLTASHSLGCSDEKVELVEVYPEAIAAATGVTTGCTPFDAALAYEGPEMAQVLWSLDGVAVGAGDGFTTTLTNGGTSTLSMTIVSEHGCEDSIDLPLVANATPEVNLGIELDAACAGTPLLLTHTATGADEVSYSLSNGASLSAPGADSEEIAFENPFANPTTVTITQTATTAAGCEATAEIEHTVYPDVEAAFEVPAAACAPFEGQLVNVTTDAEAFAWTVDGTALEGASPLHTFTNDSPEDVEVPVVLVATNGFGCADTLTQAVTVLGTPEPTLSVVELTGCYPIVATFEATGGVSAVWMHGDEDPIADAGLVQTHTFYNPYDQPIEVETVVEVANEHGCTATASLPIEVNPELTAQFDVVEAGCTPLDLVLVNQSNGGTTYEWDFGDGTTSTAANPQHTLVNNTPTDQTFVVKLIAHSGYGCTDTLAVGVEVHPEPEANFFVTPIEQTYPNTSVTFTNLSQSGAGAVHTWTFGDGGSTNNFAPGVHHYDTWGTFDVTLDVDNGYCDDAVTQTVTIHPPAPEVAFSGEAEGCAPVDVAFTNESQYAASVMWDFGDGATSTEFDPVHQYTQPGVYDVTLRITGHQGLVQEVVHTAVVTVLPSPTANFEFAPYEVVAPAEEVTFVNLSSDDAVEYQWNFGDGNTSSEQHPRHSYEIEGLFTVSLSVRNAAGCTDTHTHLDAITAKPGGFMIFPTAFTPDLTGSNGGGYNLSDLDNNVFHPHHAGITEYELSIFNIWGELIFKSQDPMIGWDGYINGLLAPQNTYVWKATARFSDGRRLIQSGDFTLIIN